MLKSLVRLFSSEIIPPERIRNFSIIAHIGTSLLTLTKDHGKSTLADRLLELTGTIRKDSQNKQVLDKLKVERERGITIKAQTASMFYNYKGKDYLLNLIDTPGHVDFSYEVSRSLAACQGSLLLVDACQGIQAQTVSNFFLAFGEGLEIVPVINKVDMQAANPEKVIKQMESVFELDPKESKALRISAKTGIGVADLLPEIIERIPPPKQQGNDFRGLLFDSWYDNYQGVICLVAVNDGVLKKGDRITSAHSGKVYEVTQCGIMFPDPYPTGALHPGQVGYMILGMKSVREAFIGDTFHHATVSTSQISLFPGFKPPKSMVFSGVYPVDAGDYNKLADAIERLTLNDSSVSVAKESSLALGLGFRLGFLGTLHMDVFRQRLEEEHDAQVITTMPTVPYRIKYTNGSIKEIKNPSEFPENDELGKVQAFMEPSVSGTLIFPNDCIGPMIELCESHRGEQKDITFIDDTRVMLKYTFPLSEVLVSFHDKLKSKSSGYASFEYEDNGYVESDLCKLSFLLNGKHVDALVSIVHRSKLDLRARQGVTKLKEVIDRDLFEIVIQARANGKIVAREGLKAFRRDVTSKCYGGDITRKMKLLEKQKEGKKRMKQVGGVKLSQEAFLALLGGS